jgi:DNA polymerase-1
MAAILNFFYNLQYIMIHFCGNQSWGSQFTSVTPKEIIDYFSNHESIQLDTETSGRDSRSKKIISLQLGDTDNQFVIDVRSVPIKLFKELIESKICLAHNAKFDYKFLLANGIVLNEIYDTMLAHVVIFNGLDMKYGLDAVTKQLLNIDLSKETRSEFHKIEDRPFTDKQIEYAGLDVAYLHRIQEVQQKFIDKYDLQFAVNVENEAVKSFADIEYNGMYLDSDEWLKIAKENENSLNKLEYDLDEYLITKGVKKPMNFGVNLFDETIRQLDINYSSPSQLLLLLREMGHLISDTNDRTLQKIKKDTFVQLLLKSRELSKKISTYGRGFLDYINTTTGRIHTDFWQIKHTFRVGSGSKDMNAPNVQNIPSSNEYRNCFKPRPGYKWVSIDYSSQELRLMADFSNEDAFIDALNSGEDLHCFAYYKMTGEAITKADKDKRNKAKTINFGKAYGMSPYKLQDQLEITLEEAQVLFEQHAKAFPKLNSWLDAQAEFGKKNNYIILNPIHKGRRWYQDGLNITPNTDFKDKLKIQGEIGRQSMNTKIQGTAAVAVKMAMSNIRNYLIDNLLWQDKVYMICTVHDQIDFEIHQDYLHIVPDIEKIMVETANIFVDKVNMEVDTTITPHWQK